MDIIQAKTQARNLAKFFSAQGVNLPYSTYLEAIAAQEGYANWQTLKGVLDAQTLSVAGKSSCMHVRSFYELPFMSGQASDILVTHLLLADTPQEEMKGHRGWKQLTRVNEELLELLAKQHGGELLTANEQEVLDDAVEDKVLLLEWGDDCNVEGLTIIDLKGIQQITDGFWQLNDGRSLEMYAQVRITTKLTR